MSAGAVLVIASTVTASGEAPPGDTKDAPVVQTQGTAPAAATAQAAPMAASVQDNMEVGLEYTLTVNGNVVDSTKDRDAFHYLHGHNQILPGLEHALAGLHVGDTKEVTVSPEEGYGPVDPAAFVELPKPQLPKEVTPTVGMVLRGMNPDGKSFRATISAVKDQSVMLDLNHPLAGKTLTFNVKVTDITPPKAH